MDLMCCFNVLSLMSIVLLTSLSDNPHTGVISESYLLTAVSLGNGSVFLLFVCRTFLKKKAECQTIYEGES